MGGVKTSGKINFRQGRFVPVKQFDYPSDGESQSTFMIRYEDTTGTTGGRIRSEIAFATSLGDVPEGSEGGEDEVDLIRALFVFTTEGGGEGFRVLADGGE